MSSLRRPGRPEQARVGARAREPAPGKFARSFVVELSVGACARIQDGTWSTRSAETWREYPLGNIALEGLPQAGSVVMPLGSPFSGRYSGTTEAGGPRGFESPLLLLVHRQRADRHFRADFLRLRRDRAARARVGASVVAPPPSRPSPRGCCHAARVLLKAKETGAVLARPLAGSFLRKGCSAAPSLHLQCGFTP